ncbi:response regulator transcription factor [Halothermothrix orenii]|uniref:Stage 0 sporulation protein A homolog n=1 Tax=Halothermothrix orenii (strain H 168 / OCM 544 / DSM 9562) TaxID=373903 RepID=B8D0H4_HALOH|nr:response regulator transcription factor [Halothermothrix orenii]ACL70910.1 two component transcriptional regulator, winged helix family [Halothermothrix orenii H 168]
MEKILVIDDEENIRELIKFNLETAGYRVELAADGEEGWDRLNDSIDLIILDLMLPRIDGLSFCRQVRSNNRFKDIPIIMLTAKGEEVDKIIGLEMGADDYITKPFSPRELVARIKAVLRRVQKNEEKSDNELIKKADFELDVSSHEARKGGEVLNLTPKEFDLLRHLLVNSGKVLTRDILLEKVWGYEYAGDTRTVDVHIRRLRRKIGDNYIVTVRGVGYKFVKLE